MNTTLRHCIAVILVVVFAGCGNSAPTSPSGTHPPSALPPPTPTPTPAPTVQFPPLSGPSRTFVFDRELSYPVRDFTSRSRFILYENGAFALHYPNIAYVYRGGYQVADGMLRFLFDSSTGRGVHEPWDDASGTLEGDSLTIRYEESMQHADFENAVYVLLH